MPNPPLKNTVLPRKLGAVLIKPLATRFHSRYWTSCLTVCGVCDETRQYSGILMWQTGKQSASVASIVQDPDPWKHGNKLRLLQRVRFFGTILEWELIYGIDGIHVFDTFTGLRMKRMVSRSFCPLLKKFTSYINNYSTSTRWIQGGKLPMRPTAAPSWLKSSRMQQARLE